jgi:hypothetical protein
VGNQAAALSARPRQAPFDYVARRRDPELATWMRDLPFAGRGQRNPVTGATGKTGPHAAQFLELQTRQLRITDYKPYGGRYSP